MTEYSVEQLLLEAKENKASDLHVTVGAPPKIRMHGKMVSLNLPEVTPEVAEYLVKEMLREPYSQILMDNGEVDFSLDSDKVGRVRINILKQKGNYAFVGRLINDTPPLPAEIGLPESLVSLTKKKRGLVLVTGPTGSGKSTTLASLINEINVNQRAHIITLEDPIEYIHPHKLSIVNQREIGMDTKSYTAALRAALREDPDVILVGEMRDLDTIATAITAAETGHLVFSTLHTIGAANTIDRVIDVFPPHQQQQIRIQLAAVLEAVISQQLLPLQDGKGRVAAFETMHANTAIRHLIREGKTHQIESIMQTGRKQGMQTMDDAIFELYLKRKIDFDTALDYAVDPFILEKKLY